jgi:hypothetical protein
MKDKQLMRLALSGLGPEAVARECGSDYIPLFRWSPDGQSFTYLVDPQDSGNPANALQWHLASGGVDRVISTAPIWCYCGGGSENNSLSVAFSPDGQFISLIDNLQKGTNLQVRRLDGSLVGDEIRGDQNYPNPVSWGTWSGIELFYRDAHGVQRWSGGVSKPFLPGIVWIYPVSSPGGGQIAYDVRGSDGLSHAYVAEVTGARVRQLSSQPRMLPVYLSPRYIWYRGERLCGANEPGICRTTTITGKTYIYDLQTGTESESIITDIADVWPHGA